MMSDSFHDQEFLAVALTSVPDHLPSRTRSPTLTTTRSCSGRNLAHGSFWKLDVQGLVRHRNGPECGRIRHPRGQNGSHSNRALGVLTVRPEIWVGVDPVK